VTILPGKSSINYAYMLVAAVVLTVLVLVIPLTERVEETGEERASKESGEEVMEKLDPAEIISRSIEAHGGRKKLSTLKTIRMSTSALIGTGKREHAEELAYYRFPDMMRSEARIGNESYVQAYDGERAWLLENGGVVDADARTTELLRRSLKHFPNFLLDAADSNAVLVEKGRSFIGGRPQYRIFVLEEDTDETTLWIDASDLLLRRMEYPIYAGESEEWIRLDFKKFSSVDGIILPYEVDIRVNGMLVQETTILDYRVNVPVADSLFARPAGR